MNSSIALRHPAAEAITLAREANDFIAAAAKRHPTRFAGFAALPVADPQKASDELDRVVRDYGFKGALINGHHRGRYLDAPFFSPLLERAAELGVPVYLHPTPPSERVIDALYGGFAPEVTFLFAEMGLGDGDHHPALGRWAPNLTLQNEPLQSPGGGVDACRQGSGSGSRRAVRLDCGGHEMDRSRRNDDSPLCRSHGES